MADKYVEEQDSVAEGERPTAAETVRYIGEMSFEPVARQYAIALYRVVSNVAAFDAHMGNLIKPP